MRFKKTFQKAVKFIYKLVIQLQSCVFGVFITIYERAERVISNDFDLPSEKLLWVKVKLMYQLLKKKQLLISRNSE